MQHPRSDAWAVRLAPFGCDSSVPSRLSVLVPTRFYDDDVIMLRMVKTIIFEDSMRRSIASPGLLLSPVRPERLGILL